MLTDPTVWGQTTQFSLEAGNVQFNPSGRLEVVKGGSASHFGFLFSRFSFYPTQVSPVAWKLHMRMYVLQTERLLGIIWAKQILSSKLHPRFYHKPYKKSPV